MNSNGLATDLRREHGFAYYVLRTHDLELAVVPELGAKIVSLKSLHTGREWLWRPQAALELFRNQLGDDFSQSTLAGADECLPTLASCVWQGRHLPDHGEAWSVPWQVDEPAWKHGKLRTSLRLQISPFHFERTIRVCGAQLRMDYQLTNLSGLDEFYLWALHPLLRLQPGDRLNLPAETRALLNGEPWLDCLDSVVPTGGCAKVFAEPLIKGTAEIANATTGDRLAFAWSPMENNTLGLWLTRGGWHGHHHFAVEPSNGSPERLTQAAERRHCGLVAALASVTWSITIRVGP